MIEKAKIFVVDAGRVILMIESYCGFSAAMIVQDECSRSNATVLEQTASAQDKATITKHNSEKLQNSYAEFLRALSQ